MKITLDTLTLQNFRGIKALTITLDGADARIYAKNYVGKTTLYSAWLWLLFGIDSEGKTDYKIIPHDEKGEEIHMLETIVEASVIIDGVPHTLRKIYKEKWTKKRGSAEKLFDGHGTDHYIDDVPKSKREYDGWIGALVDINTFRLITNPNYFNNALTWQKRREKLFEMVSTLTDEEIIASTPEFAAIDLKGRSIDDMRKIAKDTLSKLKKDKDGIPARVDELTKTMPEQRDYVALEQEGSLLVDSIADIDNQLSDAMHKTNKYTEMRRSLAYRRDNLDTRERELTEEANAGRRETVHAVSRHEIEIATMDNALFNTRNRLESINAELRKTEAEITTKRAEWQTARDEEPASIDPDALVCPTCGQGFPEDAKAQMIEDARKAVLTNKFDRLASIKAEGIELSNKREKLMDDVTALSGEAETFERNIASAKAELETLKASATEPPLVDLDADPEYAQVKTDIAALEAALATPAEDTTAELLQKKQELQTDLDIIKASLALRDVANDTAMRIRELKAEEKRLAQQMADQEKQINLLERFTTHKCNLLSDSVNALFETVRWKLFDVQVNGGISECCECTIITADGRISPNASYSEGINAGIEIADVFSRHYGISSVMFVDNSESVNELRQIDGQMIALVVSEDEKLRIEKKEVA